MATFRVGVGSFNIQDGAVGFGTDTDGLGNLKVKGVTKTTGSIVSGASTLTRYSGFAADNINQLENITLTSEVGTIGDIVVGVGTSVIISSASTVTVGTVESVSIGTHFSSPKGGIEERGDNFVEGMMRFNTDLNTMEFYNGNEWRQFTYVSDIQNSPGGCGRGVVAGGGAVSGTDFAAMTFVTVSSLGNSLNFGDLTTGNRYGGGSASNSTRGLVMGGWNGPANDFDIDYITIASEGNGIDFGENTTGGWGAQGASDSVRAICAGGGYPSASATIDMFFFSTVGSKTDFGDIKATKFRGDRAACSQVRGIFTGGYGPISNTLDTKLLASSADTTEFGTLAVGERGMTCVSNHTRGIITGWYGNPSAGTGGNFKNMDFLTITSTGTMTFFGDLTVGRGSPASIQNMVRGIFAGGRVSPTLVNTMDFITISSAGDAQDFGDLTLRTGVNQAMGMSDSHGGLGGY